MTRARRTLVVTVAGFAALTLAALTTVNDARGLELPSIVVMVAAFGLHLVALRCAARAWVSLFPPDADRRGLAAALYTSQLAKYLPAGGVLQAVSQVSLSPASGPRGSVALRLPVFALCNAVAGATIASLLVLDDDLPAWGRTVAGAGALSALLLHRRLLQGVLRLAGRAAPRLASAGELPDQAALVRCAAWGAANLTVYGVAFALLLRDVDDVSPVAATIALVAAWLIGYLVVPLPSGMGVREAVLVAVLASPGASTLLAVSVAHRLAGMGAEAVLATASRAGARRQDAARD